MSAAEILKMHSREIDGGMCYIGVCRRGQKRRIKRALTRFWPNVYRVTDHGTHIKIKSEGTLPKVRGLRVVLVADETTHWDSAYWQFTYASFCHTVKNRRDQETALRVMLHYTFNLFGEGSESRYFAAYAKRRAAMDRKFSSKQSHGWELPHVRALKKKVALR